MKYNNPVHKRRLSADISISWSPMRAVVFSVLFFIAPPGFADPSSQNAVKQVQSEMQKILEKANACDFHDLLTLTRYGRKNVLKSLHPGTSNLSKSEGV